MQLSAQSIRALCTTTPFAGRTMIEPYKEEFLQAASYDLHLGGKLLLPIHTGTPIDLREPRTMEYTEHDLTHQDYVLKPGQRALARTIEYFRFPKNIQGRMDGKSSLGRDGLETHRTAGVFDAAFEGTAVAELHLEDESEPWVLYYGMPIAQMSFYQLDALTDKPYSPTLNHYHGQDETIGNKTVDRDNPFHLPSKGVPSQIEHHLRRHPDYWRIKGLYLRAFRLWDSSPELRQASTALGVTEQAYYHAYVVTNILQQPLSTPTAASMEVRLPVTEELLEVVYHDACAAVR